MKRATGYFGLKTSAHNWVKSSFGIYVQAVWRLSIRALVKYPEPDSLGFGKKSRRKSQARYGQTTRHTPVTGALNNRIADKSDGVAEDILPAGTLTEIRSISYQCEQHFMEKQSHSLRQNLKQILPALAGFCQQRWLVLVAPPCLPSIDELKKAGINPARVLLVHSGAVNGFDVLEQTLRSGTCGAVLAWLEKGDVQTLDCLRQAAEAGNAWGVLFRMTKRKKRMRYMNMSAPRQNEGTQLKMAIN